MKSTNKKVISKKASPTRPKPSSNRKNVKSAPRKKRPAAKSVKLRKDKPATQQGPIRRPNPIYADGEEYEFDLENLGVFTTTKLPIWREWFVGVDWLRLHSSPVYYGCGVPHGARSAVILVPGFLATDIYLFEMHNWLKRIGYRPYMSRIGRNADCPNVLVQHLTATMHRAHEETGRKVHLVGHSLGGVLARIAAAYHPELTGSVISLGSPIRGIRVHPWALFMRDVVYHKIHLSQFARPRHLRPEHPDCFTSACACGFACTWRQGFPENIPQTAVYTKSDGVVDWSICKMNNRRVDVEVTGTHCGLVWNPDVYRVVAQRLAKYEKQADESLEAPCIKKAS